MFEVVDGAVVPGLPGFQTDPYYSKALGHSDVALYSTRTLTASRHSPTRAGPEMETLHRARAVGQFGPRKTMTSEDRTGNSTSMERERERY